mgnify:CR=1 FL=1|jgi:hypothetical protein
MNLGSIASPWNNEESVPRKRVATMRKTVKIRPSNTQNSYSDYSSENARNFEPSSVEDDIDKSEQHNQRVNDLIQEMTSVQDHNDGEKLANFTPPPQPVLNIKKDTQQGNPYMEESSVEFPSNPLQIKPQEIKQSLDKTHYTSHDIQQNNNRVYSNYNQSYKNSLSNLKSSIARSEQTHIIDDKLMEKINYMVHMLEGLEGEKTDNIMEEFILYTFLGVFVIFVLDSFSRTAKYTR